MQPGNIKKIQGYKIYMAKQKQLGRGAFGLVCKGVNDKTHQEVAIKILDKKKIDTDPYLKSALLSEIKIMQTVKSDNIVELYDVLESKNNYYIVQQLCQGGNLEVKMKENKIKHGKFSQGQAKKMFFELAAGFLALVKEGIIHRDFKPANVMIKSNVLKIGDFGFAKKAKAPGMILAQTIVGTPLYMPLQILKSEPYSSKCDIWALACIYYEMLHGRTPWTGNSEYELVSSIQKNPLNIDDSLSNSTKDFLRKCLVPRESKRLCWDQVFVHPIFEKKFESSASEHHQFENKLKVVMSQLRFQINANNLDLLKIMSAFGYGADGKEMSKSDFFSLLKLVYPQITEEQSQYIFNRTDIDKNGTISISQIQKLMNEHSISLTSVFKKIPSNGIKMHKIQSIEKEHSPQKKLTPQNFEKIQNSFRKLFLFLATNKKILYDVFSKFDSKNTGSLTRQQFKSMMCSLDNQLNSTDIAIAFSLIDANQSNGVEFDELNSYFSKINGIPPHLNMPPQYQKNKNFQPQIQYPPNFYNNMYDYSAYMYPNMQYPPSPQFSPMQYPPNMHYQNMQQQMQMQQLQMHHRQMQQMMQKGNDNGKRDSFILSELAKSLDETERNRRKK